WHIPPTQVPPRQSCPHAPQFAGSEETSVHAPMPASAPPAPPPAVPLELVEPAASFATLAWHDAAPASMASATTGSASGRDGLGIDRTRLALAPPGGHAARAQRARRRRRRTRTAAATRAMVAGVGAGPSPPTTQPAQPPKRARGGAEGASI